MKRSPRMNGAQPAHADHGWRLAANRVIAQNEPPPALPAAHNRSLPARDVDVPPGWRHNPAAWSQRLPIVGLALVGVGIATSLALWQYGFIERVWEPFFGEGTRTILGSELSWVLPISDAALGALAYLADAVAGIIGGRSRWRTMPWIVILFAILVGPLGLVSIGLVIAQPVIYEAWCTLCLGSAVVSIVMIAPAMDEALASLQYLRRVHDTADRSVWRAFWGLREST